MMCGIAIIFTLAAFTAHINGATTQIPPDPAGTTQSPSGQTTQPIIIPPGPSGTVSGSVSGGAGMDMNAMLSFMNNNIFGSTASPTGTGSVSGSAGGSVSGSSNSAFMDALLNSMVGGGSPVAPSTNTATSSGTTTSGGSGNPLESAVMNLMSGGSPSGGASNMILAPTTPAPRLVIGGSLTGNDPFAANTVGGSGLGPAASGPGSLLDNIMNSGLGGSSLGGTGLGGNTQQQTQPRRAGFDISQFFQMMMLMQLMGGEL